MSLCPTPLSPDCESELARLAGLVPDAELAALGATEPGFLSGGFRAGNAAALRLRLRQLACGAGELAEAPRRALARRSAAHALARLLAPDSVAEYRHALAALFGAPALLVGLLLDPRAEVRAKAEAWLRGDPAFLAVEPRDAQQQLRDAFAALTDLLAGDLASGQPATRAAWQDQKERLEARLRDAQSENRRLKGVDDRLAGAAAKLKAAEEQLAAARQRLAAVESELRQRRREHEEVAAELARETARRDERLAAALDAALAREFHGWLAQARAVEAAAADSRADLLEQAEAALRRQAETDRHSGNRARLAERLDRVEQTHARVASALRAALRPCPELAAVEAALAAERQRLAALLDPDAPASPLEQALASRLHAADADELPRLRDLPELIASLRVLDEPAVARLRLAFQKRLAAVQALGVAPDPETDERRGAVSLLGRALAGQTPAILLLDGHNVLFGLPARYSPPRGGALSDAEKRKRLADDLVRLTAPNPAVRAWIVFDGPTRQDTQAAANVRVTYSGGSGEHRADAVLLDNIRFFRSASPELPVLLVSNDAQLGADARRLGAQTVPVLELGAFF